MEKYEKLLRSSSIYNESFMDLFGATNSNWNSKTPYGKELILRHNMVCCLLCNHEILSAKTGVELLKECFGKDLESGHATQGTFVVPFNPLSLKRKLEDDNWGEVSSSPKKAHLELWEEESDSDEEMSTETMEFRSITASISSKEIGESSSAVADYEATRQHRYILAEGAVAVGNKGSVYSNRWGMGSMPWQCDIIDIKNKKFIEVKVSKRAIGSLWAFFIRKIPEEFRENVVLIVLNPTSGSVSRRGSAEKMPGEDMAVHWLNVRKVEMERRGIDPDKIEDTEALESVVADAFLLENARDWIDQLMEHEGEEDPPNIGAADEDIWTITNAQKFHEKLENPKERIAEAALYKGKLLPTVCNEKTITKERTDVEMVRLIAKNIGSIESVQVLNWEEDKSDLLISAFEEIVNQLILPEFESTFSIAKVKKKRSGKYQSTKDNISNLMKAVGIGWKKKPFVADVHGMKQPEYGGPERRRFHDWITPLIREMMKETPYNTMMGLNPEEGRCEHPVSELSQAIGERIFEIFKNTETAHTTYKFMDFFSRIGGAYLRSSGKENTHSSIAVMPLVSTHTNEESEIERSIYGFVVRGPHHVKDSTDKINILVCERVKESHDLIKYLNKGILVKTSTNQHWFVKQNAVRRADPSYLAFLHNLLFVPANFIGEMFFSEEDRRKKSHEDFVDEFIKNKILKCKEYHLERMTENTLMGILGGSQEEGYSALLRMAYMILVAWSRGENAAMWDIDGFVKGMNECLIDSAYCMWMHNGFLEVLRRYF